MLPRMGNDTNIQVWEAKKFPIKVKQKDFTKTL
jgi:hypothetical protein